VLGFFFFFFLGDHLVDTHMDSTVKFDGVHCAR
jgi:hypothetical protein